MKYFVCADIHGFYDEWIKALNEKGFDINNDNHKCIICGDLFDRGRKPKQIIDFILSNVDKFILIRGNHEDLMEDMLERNNATYTDIKNGTAYTIEDLCIECGIGESNLKEIAKKTKLQKILDLCVNYFETDKYIFVHGWIPIIENCYYFDKDWRDAREERWCAARWQNPVEMYRYKIFDPKKVIVCGHWHCSALWHAKNPKLYDEFGDKANFEPFIDEKMIALDTCTAYTKKVNVIILED